MQTASTAPPTAAAAAPMPTRVPALQVEGLGVRYGALVALDDVGWAGAPRCIGRALMMGPRALLLDEPSIGLAPKMVDQVLQTLRTLTHAGLAILLVEQNVRAAMAVVDRLVLIERGRVVLEGPAQTVGQDPRSAETYLGANHLGANHLGSNHLNTSTA